MAEKRIMSDNTRIETQYRMVELVGIRDIMFARHPGDHSTQLEWWQKVYLGPDGETLVLPAMNIMSFLSAHNTNSAPKRLLDKRKFKDVANAMLSFVVIDPVLIPFLRDGKPILLGKVNGNTDPKSGMYHHFSVGRLDKGVSNPQHRPVLPLPWSMKFMLTILPNKEIQEQQIINLFTDGGLAIGFGTFRGVFGKFFVKTWDPMKPPVTAGIAAS